ncbi:hypothetical protein ABPG74_013164 [Tetrahymena malaccensis]
MKVFALLALIALTNVYCQSLPSWTNELALVKAENCEQALELPICSKTNGNCASAFTAYQNCCYCRSSMDTFYDFYACIQRCGTQFLADPNAEADPLSSSYTNGFNKCMLLLMDLS